MSAYNEAYLRSQIAHYQDGERRNREKRQELEATLRNLLNQCGLQRIKGGCPPAFALGCVLEDGTTCPFYNDGQCVKALEVTA